MGKLSRKKPLKYPLNAARMAIDASERQEIYNYTSLNFKAGYMAF